MYVTITNKQSQLPWLLTHQLQNILITLSLFLQSNLNDNNLIPLKLFITISRFGLQVLSHTHNFMYTHTPHIFKGRERNFNTYPLKVTVYSQKCDISSSTSMFFFFFVIFFFNAVLSKPFCFYKKSYELEEAKSKAHFKVNQLF